MLTCQVDINRGSKDPLGIPLSSSALLQVLPSKCCCVIRYFTMYPNYPALSAYSGAVPSVSAASTAAMAHRKLVDYLRAETTRLIIIESEHDQANAHGISTLLCAARANIHNTIRNALQTGKCRDEYDVEKTIRLETELPAAFISLDEDFRRWTESVSCPVRSDVDMVHA